MKETTTHDISFRLEPDDIKEWEGLISPSGDFYSCGFGMHAVKAWRLMKFFYFEISAHPVYNVRHYLMSDA